MICERLEIPDVILIKPEVYKDKRGIFFESYNKRIFEKNIGYEVNFVQDNQSISKLNVLRGLHYQLPPYAQAKLVRVTKGKIYDVAVDLRKNSKYFGKWVASLLDQDNKHLLWIPRGFAHGFICLEDDSEVLYKTDNFYSPEHERSIIWNDPTINITWPLNQLNSVIISDKDFKSSVELKDADLF